MVDHGRPWPTVVDDGTTLIVWALGSAWVNVISDSIRDWMIHQSCCVFRVRHRECRRTREERHWTRARIHGIVVRNATLMVYTDRFILLAKALNCLSQMVTDEDNMII